MKMKRTISVRFGVIGVVAILLTATLLSLNYYHMYKSQIKKELAIYGKILSLNHDFTENQNIDATSLKEDVRVTLVRSDGKVLYDNQVDPAKLENHKNREEIKEVMQSKGDFIEERYSDSLGHKIIFYAKYLDNGSVLRLGEEMNSIWGIFAKVLLVTIAICLVLLVLYMVISYFIAQQVLAPIEHVAKDMNHLDSGDVYDEIRPFVEKIKSQNKMRAEFTANVSHELKTPLTSIVGYAQLIENGIAKPKDIKDFATKIDEESNRLLTLINDIMKLSKLDEGGEEETSDAVSLLKIAKSCKKRLSLKAKEKSIAFSVVGEDYQIRASESMIEELIYNLCDNSIRYNKENGLLMVSIYKKADKIVLSVKDTGIGIPKEHQEHIFERFYRVDKSHSKSTGGTGLGLSIVKHIAQYYHAEVELESEPGKGTETRILFPDSLLIIS